MPDIIREIMGFLEIDFGTIIGLIFWIGIVAAVIVKGKSVGKKRPVKGGHPTTINRPSTPPKRVMPVGSKPTVSSDGHRIPRSKDITCEGQYGHNHGERVPRFIVHEEPTEGYCNLNGKIVALRDCWKY